MSSNKRVTKDAFIPQPQENIERDASGKIKVNQEGPTVQAKDSKVQNIDHNLPKGGNPVGRGSSQHNATSGGKSLQGNNARSNPPSDKNHN
jgi:hypothetical protein